MRLTAVDPGVYRFEISRAGFETRTIEVEARHFRGAEKTVRLRPLPQALGITTEPRQASVEVVSGGKTVVRGTGKVSAKLPAGRVLVRVSAAGFNAYEHELFLDRKTGLAVRLDPKGQVVRGLTLVACAGAPKGVALTPDAKEAWTTILDGPPSIEIFEPSSGKRLGGIDIGKYGAVEVVFDKKGERAYASQMETAKVFEIDVRKRTVLRSFDTRSTWTKVVALSPDERTLYAANWSGDDVSEIDLESGRLLRRIPVADTPRGLWPSSDGKTLWVASFGTGALERVDLSTGAVDEVFTSGGALRHLVADEKRGLLYASDMAKDCVWVTDVATDKTRLFAKVDHKPNTIDLSPDGQVLFVSCRGENDDVSYYLPGPEWGSILLFATENATPLDAIVGGNQCTALDVSEDGRLLVFSDFLDNRLRSYEVPPLQTLLAGGGGRYATHLKDVVK
jgi:DNA-binding beta-propeller fold protein YncE